MSLSKTFALILTGFVLTSVPAFSETAETQLPLNGGTAVVDLPNSTAKTIKLDMTDARFNDFSVGRLIMQAEGIDLRAGTLEEMNAEIEDGWFESVMVNKMRFHADAFSFDTQELITHQRFLLTEPIDTDVYIKITEDNFQKLISSKKFLGKLGKQATKKTGGFIPFQFMQPQVNFKGGNKMFLSLIVAIGDVVGAPFEFEGEFEIKDNKLQIGDLEISSNGTPLPIDVAKLIQREINRNIDLTKLGRDKFSIRPEKFDMGHKTLKIDGHAQLKRFEFGI